MFTLRQSPIYLLSRFTGLFAAACALSAGSLAHAAPLTVLHESCSQAQREVIRTGRYYKDTFDGPVPIYGLIPVNEPYPSCSVRQRLFYVRERTQDSAACLVAFVCIAN